MALTQLFIEYGAQWFYDKFTSLRDGIPCLICSYETPEYIITSQAARSNEANEIMTPMSFLDCVVNLNRFSVSFMKDEERVQALLSATETEWFLIQNLTLHHLYPTAKGWSDFQKKAGVMKGLVLKCDVEALEQDSLAYRNPETEATALMIMCCMDEQPFESLVFFRDMA